MRSRAAAAAIAVLVGVLVAGLTRWALDWRASRGGYYPERDWSRPSRGGAHFSAFVFRDRNRDGKLNLGDQPMPFVAVEMTAPGGARTMRRSNLNGWVNFEMSRSKFWVPIHRPGDYAFHTVVPPGWSATSGNVDQTCRFERLIGAIGDTIARNPTSPVGLAPDLVIGGRIGSRAGEGFAAEPGVSLTATSPGGERVPVEVDPDGRFRVAVSPGIWLLRAEEPRLGSIERRVVVADAPVRLAAMLFGETKPQPLPRPVREDFEAVTGVWVAKIPSGTSDLQWDYLNAIAAVPARGEGYVNTVASGHYVGYSSSGHPVTISRPGGFDFVGAYFGIAWSDAQGERLHVSALRDGTKVAEETLVLSSLGPVWFDADYRGIDELRLSTEHYWQFATDDMEFRLP